MVMFEQYLQQTVDSFYTACIKRCSNELEKQIAWIVYQVLNDTYCLLVAFNAL